MDYNGKKALVLGLGESGMAMVRWLACSGASVRVADTREQPERLALLRKELPEVEFRSGELLADLLENIDFVAVSPGLMPQNELASILPVIKVRNIPLWSEIELFAQALSVLSASRAYSPEIIAITGTNGKTTVTNLTGQMCMKAGRTVRVAGNISPSVLDVLRECVEKDALPEIWVLELSSFQLWSTYTLQADVATVLNVTQDHLDWHGDIQSYADAKKRIFSPETVRVLNRDDVISMGMAAEGASVVTFGLDKPKKTGDFGVHDNRGMEWLCLMMAFDAEERGRKKNELFPEETFLQDLMPAAALRIRGRHNISNALAALALCRAIGLPLAPLLHALREYRGEPHRVEHVMTISGVSYIDDSKGTNVGATAAAVEGLGAGQKGEKCLLLIAGGDGKNQDFSPLVDPVSRYVHSVILIGKDAEVIRNVLSSTGAEITVCESLEKAVRLAAARARENDIVLLSPACASMDMFRNYAHRAEVFVSEVREIALSHGEVVL